MRSYPLLTLALVALLVIVGCNNAPSKIKAVDELWDILATGEQFELLSLDPVLEPKDSFHGWQVLGKTNVSDAATRQKLVTALKKGVEENKERIMALCFDPRHAIRVIHDGKAVDFLICFECSQVRVYVGDDYVTTLPIFPSPEPILDAVLKDANVPLADKPKKEQESQ